MLERLRALTFLMMLIGALYVFDGLNQGVLSSNSVTGLAISENTLNQQNVGCYDSDNRNYYLQGTTYASLYKANGEGPKQDACSGDDVIEYYCVFGEPEVEFYTCLNGCSNGACT